MTYMLPEEPQYHTAADEVHMVVEQAFGGGIWSLRSVWNCPVRAKKEADRLHARRTPHQRSMFVVRTFRVQDIPDPVPPYDHR